jgi:mannosylglycerate hydrolase MGH1-like protein/glycosyl hydrolase family 63
MSDDPETRRLAEDARREKNWKRWGPYLSERQWGTVREDYSADGTCWEYFPHDHARSRAYRWGEDGLLGICDREGRLCFALALWNGRDPILKERLFGLSGNEGNHGEDVKECYFYLESTPTHSYAKALYKYPQSEYPYQRLVTENRSRPKTLGELDLIDTGILDDQRYFDVTAEYAKAAPDDILCRVTVHNHGAEPATLHLLPTLWFRNTWSWGRDGEGYWSRPDIRLAGQSLVASHASLGSFRLDADATHGGPVEFLFTENETNTARLWGVATPTPFVKDSFHSYLVLRVGEAVNRGNRGTKAAVRYRLEVPARGDCVVRLRLARDEGEAAPAASASGRPFDEGFEQTFRDRIREADVYYDRCLPAGSSPEERRIARQAYAGLLWSKQFYHYVVKDWIDGDPAQPPPPAARRFGRNHDWPHLYNRDVISMPDKWEYPWYAAWDLAFHMLPMSRVDPDFAKEQLILFLREWYMHPNGQIPAYEFAFGDVNPPVHAWSAWRVYKMTGPRGGRDRRFLARVFQKLLLNFTWWVNRKDVEGDNIFAGGFLGLDNIGVFDRSKPLPTAGYLEQADGTAWMAFYCATMLSIALELAREEPAYEDLASKFFEHFVAIADAMNGLGGVGLWDELDGFYYDQLRVEGQYLPLRVRSMVGLIPLYAVEVLDQDLIDRLPGFKKRLEWFLENRGDLARCISYVEAEPGQNHRARRLLAIPSRDRLVRVLGYMLDENEFLSPHGIRSLSRVHREHPYVFRTASDEARVDYAPGESGTGLFGGNSNWRGPVWFPVNYLLVEALERYHHYYGDRLQVECPTGSGVKMNLGQVAAELASRLLGIFLPDARGRRPVHGGDGRFADDPAWRDLLLYYEYFHGDDGHGLGASHQTGWTALVAQCIEHMDRQRRARHRDPA